MKKRGKLLIGAVVAILALAIIPLTASAQQGPATPPDPARALIRALTDAAAQTLDMTPQAFAQAMRQGKTPAQLAKEAGVANEDLAAAMQSAWNAQGETFIGKFIEKGLPPRTDHRRQRRNARLWIKTASKTLDMPVRTFVQELRSGQTPAQIAEEHDSSGQALIDAIVAAEKAHLDKAVAEGKLTQEKADEILSNISEKVTQWVQNGPPKPPAHPQP
jgi:uncharacterized protein (DUF433 family)